MTRVADLTDMDRSALAALWSDLLRSPVPPKTSQDMMRRVIAWELQAKQHGALPAKVRRELAKVARQEAVAGRGGKTSGGVAQSRTGDEGAAPDARTLKAGAKRGARPLPLGPVPGTRLVREWNRVTHVVEVTETGATWNGQHWRSLSAVAREITGAHWSGPRFFGLTGKRS